MKTQQQILTGKLLARRPNAINGTSDPENLATAFQDLLFSGQGKDNSMYILDLANVEMTQFSYITNLI